MIPRLFIQYMAAKSPATTTKKRMSFVFMGGRQYLLSTSYRFWLEVFAALLCGAEWVIGALEPDEERPEAIFLVVLTSASIIHHVYRDCVMRPALGGPGPIHWFSPKTQPERPSSDSQSGQTSPRKGEDSDSHPTTSSETREDRRGPSATATRMRLNNGQPEEGREYFDIEAHMTD